MTPVRYYQRHRAHVMQNAACARERIYWDNRDQAHDEIIGPIFHDYILYNVLKEIDPRLLEFVQNHYQLKMQTGWRLMDVKDDIFSNIPHFLEEIKQQHKEDTATSVRLYIQLLSQAIEKEPGWLTKEVSVS